MNLDRQYSEETEEIRDNICKIELKINDINQKFFTMETKNEEFNCDSKNLGKMLQNLRNELEVLKRKKLEETTFTVFEKSVKAQL